jgi:hypothetical protein
MLNFELGTTSLSEFNTEQLVEKRAALTKIVIPAKAGIQ